MYDQSAVIGSDNMGESSPVSEVATASVVTTMTPVTMGSTREEGIKYATEPGYRERIQGSRGKEPEAIG